MDDQLDGPGTQVFRQWEHDTVDHGDRMLEIAGGQHHGEVLSRESDSGAQISMSCGGLVGRALANEPVNVAVDRIHITQHGDQIASRIDVGVVGDDHDRTTRDAAEFANPGLELVVPMVDREHRQRSVHARVAQRERTGTQSQRRSRTIGPLASHHVTRLERQDITIAGFVGPGPSTNVQDGPTGAESAHDRSCQLWVFAARRRVPLTNHVGVRDHPANRTDRPTAGRRRPIEAMNPPTSTNTAPTRTRITGVRGRSSGPVR